MLIHVVALLLCFLQAWATDIINENVSSGNITTSYCSTSQTFTTNNFSLEHTSTLDKLTVNRSIDTMVHGPEWSSIGGIPRFINTTGTLIEDSSLDISEAGNISGIGSIEITGDISGVNAIHMTGGDITGLTNLSMSGELTNITNIALTGGDITGAKNIQCAGNLDIGNDTHIVGNLVVDGTITGSFVERSTVRNSSSSIVTIPSHGTSKVFSAPANDKLSFKVNGTEKMGIDATSITVTAALFIVGEVVAQQSIQSETLPLPTVSAHHNTAILVLNTGASNHTIDILNLPPNPVNGQLFTVMLGSQTSDGERTVTITSTPNVQNPTTSLATKSNAVTYIYLTSAGTLPNQWYQYSRSFS